MAKRSVPLIIALFLLPQNAGAGSLYGNALEHYKAGHYREAASGFSAASLQEPSKQINHYLLANCLVHIDQHERAAEEYKVAYLLDPSSSVGEFCRQAILAYKKPLPTVVVCAHASAADKSELERVKKLIQQQASFEKDKHSSIATRGERSIRSQVDEQLRLIDQQMQSEIQKLHDPLVYTPAPRVNPLLSFPDLLKEKEDQIKAQAVAEKERVIKAATERSQIYESWRKDRAALLDESADNLQKQLEQPVGPSGVKLQTHGTGLYVRYYGKAGQNKLPEVHAATARISDANAQIDMPSESESLPQGAKEVKGTVIKDAVLLKKANLVQETLL